MKIVLINGSQKTGGSNSGIILDWIKNLIKEKHEVEIYNPRLSCFTEESFKNIVSNEAVILEFPLFLFSVPSHTLKMLIEMENIIKRDKAYNLIIYTVINCGFYEGKQCNVAFKIIENWCERSGVKFGGGIGQGAGEMLGQTKNIPMNKGPFNNLARSLQAMIDRIELKEPFGVTYLNPYFPRFLWKIMATRFWNDQARKNGLKKRDIIRGL
jgi:multimeric flavodoxin WrbA